MIRAAVSTAAIFIIVIYKNDATTEIMKNNIHAIKPQMPILVINEFLNFIAKFFCLNKKTG